MGYLFIFIISQFIAEKNCLEHLFS